MPIKFTPKDDNEGAEVEVPKRIKGRKPRKGFTNGGPRPGSGRPKGVKQDPAIKHIRELAREHTPMCVQQLVRLASRARSETARAMAINMLMDRAWGKAPQSIKMSGDAENPLRHIHANMTPEQAAAEYANTLESRAAEESED